MRGEQISIFDTEKKRYGKKRLTSRSHYEASLVLKAIEDGTPPDYITWEIRKDHVEILKMFIIEGMNAREISDTNRFYSKRNRPMSPDMISLLVKKYLPFVEYDERSSSQIRNKDREECRKFARLKKEIPKTPCAICGSMERLELDHIIPYSQGGRAEKNNLRWLCHKCHWKKTKSEKS